LKNLKNFDQWWNTDEILNISVNAFAALLKSDELVVDSENTLFQAVFKWYDRDDKSRNRDALKLLKLVRYPMMTTNFLMDVIRGNKHSSKLKGPPEYKEYKQLVNTAISYHSASPERRKNILSKLTSMKQFTVRKAPTTTNSFHWDLNVTPLTESKEHLVESPTFHYKGYAWALGAVVFDSNNTTYMNYHLEVNTEETKLKDTFYVNFRIEFLVRNPATGMYGKECEVDHVFDSHDNSGGWIVVFEWEKIQKWLKDGVVSIKAHIYLNEEQQV